MPRRLCAFRTLAACVPHTTSHYCTPFTFGARIAQSTKLDRVKRRSKGPVPNTSKRESGSANLGSSGLFFGKATQGSQSSSCLSDWRCKSTSKKAERRRLRGIAARKTSRPSGQSRAKAKGENDSYLELLSRVDEIG